MKMVNMNFVWKMYEYNSILVKLIWVKWLAYKIFDYSTLIS